VVAAGREEDTDVLAEKGGKKKGKETDLFLMGRSREFTMVRVREKKKGRGERNHYLSTRKNKKKGLGVVEGLGFLEKKSIVTSMMRPG